MRSSTCSIVDWTADCALSFLLGRSISLIASKGHRSCTFPSFCGEALEVRDVGDYVLHRAVGRTCVVVGFGSLQTCLWAITQLEQGRARVKGANVFFRVNERRVFMTVFPCRSSWRVLVTETDPRSNTSPSERLVEALWVRPRKKSRSGRGMP